MNSKEYRIGAYKNLTRVEYVNQLQNLFYSLTGEELTIKKDETTRSN